MSVHPCSSQYSKGSGKIHDVTLLPLISCQLYMYCFKHGSCTFIHIKQTLRISQVQPSLSCTSNLPDVVLYIICLLDIDQYHLQTFLFLPMFSYQLPYQHYCIRRPSTWHSLELVVPTNLHSRAYHGSFRVRSTNFLLNLRDPPPISMKFDILADNA